MRGCGQRAGWVLLCYWLVSISPPPTTAFSAIYHQTSSQGRKFGGYRIVPKTCKDLTTAGRTNTGVCMFNYECSKKNGTVVGSCMDGFLFGACCRLPAGANYASLGGGGEEGGGGGGEQPPATPSSASAPTSTRVAVHGSADTVLLNEDGSLVDDTYRPEDFQFNSRPELFLPTESPRPPQHKSTTWHSPPSPHTSRPTQRPHWSTQWTQQPGNMVQVATIPAGGHHEESANAESINHILHILNDTEPLPEPEPSVHSSTTSDPALSTWVSVDDRPSRPTYYSSTTHHYHVRPQPTRYSTTPAPSKRPQYTNSYTKRPSTDYPYKKPSTVTTQHVQGPGFQVTGEEPAPTVIVLAPASPTKRPSLTVQTGLPTIITVNTEGNLVTYRPPPAATAKPVYHGVDYGALFTTHKPSRPPTQAAVVAYQPSEIPVKRPAETTVVTGYYEPVKKPVKTTTAAAPANVYFDPDRLKPVRPQTDATVVTGYYEPVKKPAKPLADATVVTGYYEPVQTTPGGGSTEVLVAFPPDRDPNSNLTVQEPPEMVNFVTQTTLPDQTTPELIEDEKLDNKVHKFVEKIVQSLQGNFVDLENVLLDGGTTNTTTKRPTTTKKPPKKKATTAKPKPTPPLITRPPPRPSTPPTSKRPTKRPQTVATTPKRPRPTTTVFPPEADVIVSTITTSSTTEGPQVDFRKECGVRPLMKNGRIVGGKGATFGEWPWQVLVREATWLGLFTKNKCGGVLITGGHVITAAHCQPGFLASLVAVFGEFDLSGDLESKRSVTRSVRRVVVHRYYDAATFENDIALLELDSPVQFDHHIVPICMPKDGDDFTGRMATVTGWGRLKYGGGVPSVLQEVQVPVIENNVCQEMFHTAGHSKTILNSFICAGYANGQRDSCEGDSGGPLMVERDDGRWVLAGTVSHGIKCAAPYLPGVYMRTTYYKPWLQTITGVKDQ